ncbi:hypothetical protein KIPB_010924, partial [Kipferlia bialata]
LGLKADRLRQRPIRSEEDERRLAGLLSSVALLGDTTGSRELDLERAKVTMNRLSSTSATMSEDTLQFAEVNEGLAGTVQEVLRDLQGVTAGTRRAIDTVRQQIAELVAVSSKDAETARDQEGQVIRARTEVAALKRDKHTVSESLGVKAMRINTLQTHLSALKAEYESTRVILGDAVKSQQDAR